MSQHVPIDPSAKPSPPGIEQPVPLYCYLPALLLLMVPVSAFTSAAIGSAITLAVPFAGGAIVGAATPRRRLAVEILAISTLGGAIATGLFMHGDIGVFCAVCFTLCAVPPALLGWAIAATIRQRLAKRRADRTTRSTPSRSLLLLLLAATPLPVHWIESQQPRHHADEQLVFTRTVAAAAADIWATSLSFADTNSVWQHIHAPLPRTAIGHATAAGDEKTLHFDKGVIRVRVTAVEPGRRLVANVLEQTIETRALRLHRVTFAVAPLTPSTCVVSITLDHTPLMTPRWHWRPYERLFGGITFDAVIDDLLAPRPIAPVPAERVAAGK